MSLSHLEAELQAHLPARMAGMPVDTPVLLALSGGADSRVLLHLLARASQSDGFRLALAHVNHGIRGEEALRDRRFCEQLAEQYGLPIFLLDADVPALAREHCRSLEEEGRHVRYDFFASLMEKEGFPLLVTAHHADDNLETALFRLTRGTGLSGLSGIRPVRPFAEGALVRPLLTVTRAEIEAYCAEHRLQYVTDSTNLAPIGDRNRLRNEVLPRLRALRPSLTETSVRTLASLREDEELLSSLAAESYARLRTPTGLSAAPLAALPRPLGRRVLLLFLQQADVPTPDGMHLDAALSLAGDGKEGEALTLPGERMLLLEQNRLRLCSAKARPQGDPPAPWKEFPLKEGAFSLPLDDAGELWLQISVTRGEKGQNIHKSYPSQFTKFTLPSAILIENCTVRPRREGDRILQGGMHRPLRRLWAAAGIPARLRDRMPLLSDAEGVLWAPMVGARDGLSDAASEDSLTVRVTLPDILWESSDA